MIKMWRARASAVIDNQRRNSSSNESQWRVQTFGILKHGKRRCESSQGSVQAKDHCSTWLDQMPSSHTRASNRIVHNHRYGSLLLLSSTHWVVCCVDWVRWFGPSLAYVYWLAHRSSPVPWYIRWKVPQRPIISVDGVSKLSTTPGQTWCHTMPYKLHPQGFILNPCGWSLYGMVW